MKSNKLAWSDPGIDPGIWAGVWGPIVSDAEVYSSFLQKGHTVNHKITKGWGAYLYVLEGGPVTVNGKTAPELTAVMAKHEKELEVTAGADAELLLVHVLLVEEE